MSRQNTWYRPAIAQKSEAIRQYTTIINGRMNATVIDGFALANSNKQQCF
jgi:hypothetical protein